MTSYEPDLEKNAAMIPSIPANGRITAIVAARIGDTLLVTPALRALKSLIPYGELTVLAHPKRACLLEGLPFIDRLGDTDKHRVFWRARTPSKRHDLSVIWGSDQPLVNYGLRAARHTIAFESPNLPKDARLLQVPRPTISLHAVHERMLLAQAAGANTTDLRLAYVISESERAAARRWLDAASPAKRWVGIQTTSFPTKSHRDWPVEHFAALIAKLAAAYPDIGFVALGDKTALPAAHRLSAAAPGRVATAAGKFDLRMAAAVIDQMALYIGVDTGPTHIAGALGVPMVALYHCAYPGRNLAPLGHSALRMIEHPATGLPGADTQRSMAEIPVEMVVQAATDLLEQQS